MAIIVRDRDGAIAAARGEEPPFDNAVLHVMPDGEIVWSDVPEGKCPKCGWDWEDRHDCPADSAEAREAAADAA